jgi:hypothetical protein
MKQCNQQQAVELMADGVSFDAASLHGRTVTYHDGGVTGRWADNHYPHWYGEMCDFEYNFLRDAVKREDVTYIVYSYATPIAWRYVSGAWYECAQKHSRTTSKHHSFVRRAIGAVRHG